jgi:uncharacterized protein
VVRILGFLLFSTTAHFLVARWVLATSPWARARRGGVYLAAAGVSIFLASLRLLGWLFEKTILHDVVALSLIELSAVILALPLLGVVTLGSRTIARGADLVRPPPDEEARAARISRREAIERVAGLTVASASTVALGWGIVRGRHSFALEEVLVRIPGWPRALDGYVIAQVSDIHVGAFVGERELEEGFELVRRIRPDLLVATGDLVDARSNAIGPLVAQLLRVGARDGAHVILGNHDHYAGAAEVARHLRAAADGGGRARFRFLDNEAVHLRPDDGGGFALLGVDDLQGRLARRPGPQGPDLAAAIAQAAPDRPRILLAHQPTFFLEAAGDVALQLSGHTHGGQINPGFRPADAIMPFVSGRYERAGSTLWVNRGFGVVGPPARIGSAPEVTKLVIVAA